MQVYTALWQCNIQFLALFFYNVRENYYCKCCPLWATVLQDHGPLSTKTRHIQLEKTLTQHKSRNSKFHLPPKSQQLLYSLKSMAFATA